MTRVPMVLLAIALVACGGGAEWSGTVVDSAGIQLVHNTEQGAWGVDDAWTFEQELRIGNAEGDPDYQFGQIQGVIEGRNGQIFVFDQQARHVKAFSSDGAYLRTFGQEGSGPGELSNQSGPILPGPGDTILVPDFGNQRVNRYREDGTSQGSFRLSLSEGLPLRWLPTPSGHLASQVRPLDLPDTEPDSMDVVIIRSAEGTILDTLLRFASGETISFRSGLPEFRLFVSEPFWVLRDDRRVVFGINDEFRIGMYAADGTLERVLTKPWVRQPVSADDQSTIIDSFERLWRTAGLPPQVVQQLRQNISFAEFYPAYLQIVSGPDESVWVQRIQRPAELSGDELEGYNPQTDLGGADWDVFDAEGRYMGVVRTPRRFAATGFTEDRMYGVWRVDLDVQYVVRLRLVRPELES